MLATALVAIAVAIPRDRQNAGWEGGMARLVPVLLLLSATPLAAQQPSPEVPDRIVAVVATNQAQNQQGQRVGA